MESRILITRIELMQIFMRLPDYLRTDDVWGAVKRMQPAINNLIEHKLNQNLTDGKED